MPLTIGLPNEDHAAVTTCDDFAKNSRLQSATTH
jgi:hypothetical protein